MNEILSIRRKMSGSFPEYGAIFMSNRSTMKESFEKSLFGLPSLLSNFVRGIKAGMILFLFEHEERKLYGVFKAISDGGINIIPRAYASSGKQFPAQVKFATIWHCDPLSEDEFSDAIRDNYFETHKFRFGLSKSQIQSLLWLFNSRKLVIPNSLCINKNEDRELSYKCFEGGVKEGRFTEIEVSRRKLNMDAGISVITEVDSDLSPAVGYRQSFSFGNLDDTSRKSENIHCEDDAYDPEHPSFNYSTALVIHHDSAAGHEPGLLSNNFVGQELVTLQEEKENFHISAENVEDFIPLSSPDHSDLENEEVAFNECYGEKEIELGEFVGYTESFFSVPKLPLEPFLSNEGFSQVKMEYPFASPRGSSCTKTDDSSSTAFSLSDASDHSKNMLSKGMYSDHTSNRRASVFSRLNFASKDMVQGNQKDTSGGTLVNGMLRVKQQSNDKIGDMEKAKPQKHEIEGCKMNKRTSVFLRLSSASEDMAEERARKLLFQRC